MKAEGPEKVIKSRQVMYRIQVGRERPEYKLKTVKNLGLRRFKLKLKTIVNSFRLERRLERKLKIETLRLMIINVVPVLAPMKTTFYQVQDASGCSVPALGGSMKTVSRTVK